MALLYRRKKNRAFTLSSKEQYCYDIFLYSIWFWDFMAQRKPFLKPVKGLFKRFIIKVSFA